MNRLQIQNRGLYTRHPGGHASELAADTVYAYRGRNVRGIGLQ